MSKKKNIQKKNNHEQEQISFSRTKSNKDCDFASLMGKI